MKLDDAIAQVRDECDNYNQTVQALKALANELLWDEAQQRLVADGKAYFGRKMDTSSANRISPDAQVTPDLLVLRSQNANYYVVEGKLALSKDPAKREAKLIEIQKYDDDFRGWDGSQGRVASHDIILLVRFFHGVNVRNQIAQLRADKKMMFERNFAVVTFHRVVETETWMSLELLDGILRPKEKQEKLARRDKPIRLDLLVANPQFGHVKLYDAPPPAPLLMDQIHETILATLPPEDNLQLMEEGKVEREMDLGVLRDMVSESFGPSGGDDRTPDIPKQDWVRHAMVLFAKLGWAKQVGRSKYVYEVRQRRNPFDQFVKLRAREVSKTAEMRAKVLAKEKEKYPLFQHLIESNKPSKT